MELFAYALIGLITGVFSGLLGLGGGLVMVPFLVAMFQWQHMPENFIMHIATGTSLAAMIFTTFMTTWSHHKRGSVQWSLLKRLLPSTMAGSLLGVAVARSLSTQGLKSFFALLACLLGLRIIWTATKPQRTTFHHLPSSVLILSVLCIGMMAGMLGVGGGVLLIPLLMWLGLPIIQASATSSACAFGVASIGAIASVFAGSYELDLPAQTLGFVYWPAALILGLVSLLGAPLGVALANKLPVPMIKRIFGGVLVLIAWQMLPPLPKLI